MRRPVLKSRGTYVFCCFVATVIVAPALRLFDTFPGGFEGLQMNSANFDKTLVLIPARMASTRLPGKPLADIAGLPMIVQVARRAAEADVGRIVVAVDHQDIFDAVVAAGFEAVMTRVDHQSGSDRIHEALTKSDPEGRAEIIINVQGDLPTIDPETIRAALRPLENAATDIATLTTEIRDEEEKTNPNVVKVVGSPLSESRLRALYFTRATAPYGKGPLYHHIGLYAYRRKALEAFVALKPSTLERRESLEQLRALEAGMRIDAEIVDTVPLGVDTPADLEKARAMLAANPI
jgi:3-deoxy-manno-octulosonate cytidylyltransferase (CMP-KDO synthetase)